MTVRPVRPLRVVRWAAAMAASATALLGASAQAMTVNYQCIGYRPLSAELTPRQGQIHFEGKDWTVTRVPDAHEARYVNSRAGVTVVTRQREMTFTHGAETLKCVLKSDALSDEALGVHRAPPASAPAN